MAPQVTGIPQNNYESFQILRYEEGQASTGSTLSSVWRCPLDGEILIDTYLPMERVWYCPHELTVESPPVPFFVAPPPPKFSSTDGITIRRITRTTRPRDIGY
jgi:hypothetical protein